MRFICLFQIKKNDSVTENPLESSSVIYHEQNSCDLSASSTINAHAC